MPSDVLAMPRSEPAAFADEAETAVRFCDAPDPAAYAALLRSAFAEHEGRLDPPAGAARETAESISALLAAGEWCLLAGPEAAPVAGLLARPEGDAVYLHRLAVHPGFRGRGIAAALIEAAIARAAADGARIARLDVRLALEANQRLFRRLGFEVVDRRSHPGYDRVTFLRMEKRIGSDG